MWVCIEEHYCFNHYRTEKYFCWVLDESKAKNGEVAPGQYVPSDYNANLQIVEHSDVSCSWSVTYARRRGHKQIDPSFLAAQCQFFSPDECAQHPFLGLR